MITAEDDLFHQRTDDPYWNESSWFSVSIPERSIQGYICIWYRPNMGMCCAGPGFWDDRSTGPADALYWDVHWLQHIPEGNMLSSTYPNGLGVERLEPGRRFRFCYDVADCAFDLTFDALGDAHEVRPEDPVWGAASPSHFEQPGRMQGSLVLGGEELTVDCTAMRDRSWGPRRLDKPTQGDYLWGVESERDSFHVFSVNDGSVNQVRAGYLLRDGVMADIVSGQTSTTYRVRRLQPRQIVVDAVDTLGRTIHAEGLPRNGLIWELLPRLTCSLCMVEWDVDGRRVWGEQQEYFPNYVARDLLRGASPGR